MDLIPGAANNSEDHRVLPEG